MGIFLSLSVLLSLVHSVYCWPGYRKYVPNGRIIPHPCNSTIIWKGLGHHIVRGGGERNQFGLDFLANDKTWNRTLCEMDSDQDGKTNGEELGDPNCVFERDGIPERNTSLSHPGVCEPPLSTHCLRVNGLWMNITGCENNAGSSLNNHFKNYVLHWNVVPVILSVVVLNSLI